MSSSGLIHPSSAEVPDAGAAAPEAVVTATLTGLAQVGARGGVASAYAYLAMRARLFPQEPQVTLKIAERYTLLDKLGEGSMGVVFAAIDARLARKVALKFVRTRGDDRAKARLEREAHSLAKLSDPHVVQVYDVGNYHDEVYLAMEYVEGASLAEWVATARPGVPALLDILIAAGRGLAAAHARGIVHRDIKPANILVGADGRARVADFGLAWNEPHERSTDNYGKREPDPTNTSPARMSLSGAGTPAYMSPEQFLRDELDLRSDLFSFCVVVWEMVYGARPFVAPTTEALSKEICAGRITPPAARPRGAPAKLEKILRRGLATSPSARQADMAELLSALTKIRHPSRKLPWLIGPALGALAAFALVRDTGGLCSDFGHDLDTFWPEGQDADLLDALSTVARHAPQTVVGRVQKFADDLKETATVLCSRYADGTLSDSQYHRAQACLNERKQGLASVLVALRGPAQGLSAAPDALEAALGSARRCGNSDYLASELDPPPEGAERIGFMRAAANAELIRGDYRKALGHLENAVAKARELGYDPATAKVLYDLGRTLLRLRRGRQARDALHEARLLADGAGDRYAAADASLLLMNASVASNKLEDAEWDYKETRARLIRTNRARGGPLGELELARVDLLTRQGSFEEATTVLNNARTLLEEDRTYEGLWRFNLYRSEAKLARELGDPSRAAVSTGRAREELRALTGDPEHPLYLEELGRSYMAQEDFGGAEESYERARDIYAKALGTNSPHCAIVEVALARLFFKQRRHPEAIEAALRADEILRQQPDEPMTLDERAYVAYVLADRSAKQPQSEPPYKEAIEILDRVLPALARTEVTVLDETFVLLASQRAELHLSANDPANLADAKHWIGAATTRATSSRSVKDRGVITFMSRVAADVALKFHNLTEAQRHMEKALNLLAEEQKSDPEMQARLNYIQAQVLGQENPRGRELATQARDYFREKEDTGNADEISKWLAGKTNSSPPR